jgi:hypothetical protein
MRASILASFLALDVLGVGVDDILWYFFGYCFLLHIHICVRNHATLHDKK